MYNEIPYLEYKLRDWINPKKLYWELLSENPNAIHLLSDNPDKIDWHYLSNNPNALYLLEKNLDKIDWHELSRNPNAIYLLEQNPDNIFWSYFIFGKKSRQNRLVYVF